MSEQVISIIFGRVKDGNEVMGWRLYFTSVVCYSKTDSVDFQI